jgi:hypothetical protein
MFFFQKTRDFENFYLKTFKGDDSTQNFLKAVKKATEWGQNQDMASLVARVEELLGQEEAENLLCYQSKTIEKSLLHLPGPDFVDRIFIPSGGCAGTLSTIWGIPVLEALKLYRLL